MVAGVLVVVDEDHGGVAVLAPPGGRHLVRRAAFDFPGEGVRGPPQVRKAPPRLDPDVDVQAIAARGFGPPGHPEFAEDLVHDAGDPAHSGELAARHGIQVDAPLIGPLGVGLRPRQALHNLPTPAAELPHLGSDSTAVSRCCHSSSRSWIFYSSSMCAGSVAAKCSNCAAQHL